MANVSQQRREKMLEVIAQLRDERQDDVQIVRALNEIEKTLNEKKYGLVWEEHTERVDEMLENNIPVLEEVQERKIVSNEEDAYNFLIEGDNLHALKLLEKTHRGKVDVIYIDPPYNTGNDFIYDDSYVDKNDSFKYSKWLSFMSWRLNIAKNLLSEKGVIFISIDDRSAFQLKLLCDSIFSDNNFITSFIRKTKSMTGDDGNGLNIQHEYLLTYAKDKSKVRFIGEEKSFDGYANEDNDPNGIWISADPTAKSGGDSTYFPIINPYTGKVDYPSRGRYWAFSKETLEKYIESGKIKFKESHSARQRGFIFKRYASMMEEKNMPVDSLAFVDNIYMNSVATTELKNIFEGESVFSYPKPTSFVKKLVEYTSKKDSIILDFFAGSGTTGHAVATLNKEDGGNRRYILCTNNENGIAENVTYKRLTAIQDELPHNLKYFKTEYVPKFNEDTYVSSTLLEHIKPLIELEYACNLEDSKFDIILDEDEFDRFIDDGMIKENGVLFIASDILMSADQEQILKDKNCKVEKIPEYYYKEELIESGEI